MAVNRRSSVCLTIVAAACLVYGCGDSPPPLDARENRLVLDALATAIGMKSSRLLDQGEERLATRYEDGFIPDELFEEFQEITERARSGDWAVAERQAEEFRKRHPFFR